MPNSRRARTHDEFDIDCLTIRTAAPEFESEAFHFCDAGASRFESNDKIDSHASSNRV